MGHPVGPAADLFSWGEHDGVRRLRQRAVRAAPCRRSINQVLNNGRPNCPRSTAAARGGRGVPGQGPRAAAHRRAGRSSGCCSGRSPCSGILAQGSAAAIPAESRPAHSAPNPAASRPAHSAPNPAASWPAPAAYPAQPPMAAHAGQPRPAPAAKGRTLLVMGAAVGCALLLLAGVMTVNHLNRTTVAAPRTSPTPTPTTPAPAPASTVPAKGTPLRVPGGSIHHLRARIRPHHADLLPRSTTRRARSGSTTPGGT